MQDPKIKTAVYSAISTVMAVVVLLFALMISNNNSYKWDLTSTQRYSLAQQSVDVVKNLKTPVALQVFLSSDDQARRKQVMDLLDNYKNVDASKFSYKFIDPKKEPLAAQKYEITQPGTIVAVSGAKTERINGLDEESITNSLASLNANLDKKIYFLAGHGEKALKGDDVASMSQLVEAMMKEGMSVSSLNLVETPKIPQDAKVLVIAGPKQTFFEKEQKLILDWMAQGGSVLLGLDIQSGNSCEWLLKKYALSAPEELIIDMQATQISSEPVFAIGAGYSPDSQITKGFTNFTLFRLARPIKVLDKEVPQNATVLPFVFTGQQAFSIDAKDLLSKAQTKIDPKDAINQGIMPMACSGEYPLTNGKEAKTKCRLIAVGSADVMTNVLLKAAANRDLVLNMMNWLCQNESSITIRPKDAESQPLILSERQSTVIKLLLIVALPLAVLLAGLSISRRRH